MNDLHTTLLQMLAGNSGVDATAQLHEAVRTRLAQRPPNDPLRAAVLRMLPPPGAKAESPLPAPQALLRAARDALMALQSRTTVLASALGACAECWGTEAGCPVCHGNGRPGWTSPDPASFEAWVAPAVAAMARDAARLTRPRNPWEEAPPDERT
jgi:hypothetical protein